MNVNRKSIMSLALFLLVISASAGVSSTKEVQGKSNTHAVSDSIVLHNPELGHLPKMSTSHYPIEMTINRRSIKIRSNHEQILPIYRQNGTFYMVMRLHKGVNWVNGLPSGRYYINNKSIAIN